MKTGFIDGVKNCVGDTPLILLPRLSSVVKSNIFVKAEQLSCGASVKDRAAKAMIEDAIEKGTLLREGLIVEATGGNTGHTLAMLGSSMGLRVTLAMHENVSQEKVRNARLFGAKVIVCPLVKDDHPEFYCNVAKRIAEEEGGLFLNQFDNLSNHLAHYKTTGPEILKGLNEKSKELTAFISGSGTGGTIAGCVKYFAEACPSAKFFLVDPPGSGLIDYVLTGEFISTGEKTVTEGVGITRKTANFEQVKQLLHGAFKASNQEITDMQRYVMKYEGLFIGPSAAMNILGAVKAAHILPEGSNIVTVICDSGERYASKNFNEDWLVSRGVVANNFETDSLGWIENYEYYDFSNKREPKN